MSLFFHHHDPETKTIEELVEIVKELMDELRKEKERRNKPILALTININGTNYIIMNTTLNLGLNAISNLVLLDNKTLLPNNTASFSGQSATSDNPAVATFTMDSTVTNQVDATPVAVGTCNLLLSSVATYTDSDTNQSVTQTFTNTIAVTVTTTPEGLTLTITGFTNVPATTTSTTTTSTTTIV